MRIISGSARGTRLRSLEGEKTRPTLERVKEAIFSMIQFEVSGAAVLDLFSGSGQMALEALSRGAESADMVDFSEAALGIIRENTAKTHMQDRANLIRSDALSYLRRIAGKKRYDIVLLDPPYASGLIPSALDLLYNGKLLKEGAIVVCEGDADGAESALLPKGEAAKHFTVRKNARYAKTRVILLDFENSSDLEVNDGTDE